jgi:hypothetical protein
VISRLQTPRAPRFVLAIAALAILLGRASFAQTTETSGAFWPGADLHLQLTPNLRALAFAESRTDQDFPYRQVDFGGGLGLQWWRFTQPHAEDIDPDKENYLVTAAGYEHLQTFQSGNDTIENRLAVEATPRFRLGDRLLLSDRNRVEFRWVNGDYSTRYRNLFAVEYDAAIHGVRFAPYASAEFFYDITTSTWKQEWYTAGFQVPYRKWLMVDLYYLRQNCPSCQPEFLNVLGLVVNFYVDAAR